MPHLPGLLRPEPMSPRQATADLCICRRYSNTQSRSGSDSVGSLGPGVHKVLFEPSKHLWWVWVLILNTILPLLPSCWGLSFALGQGVSFLVGSNILFSMVVQQQVAILEFLQEKMSTRPSTKIVASDPITAWQIDGETMETMRDFSFSWAPKSLQLVTAAMKLKDTCSLEEKL